MSRSGYNDYECDDYWQLMKYRGQVASATRGKRGQLMFRELLAALDALLVKRLIEDDFEFVEEGEACALGVLGQARGIDMSKLYGPDGVGDVFGIADQLAAEVMYENDDCGLGEETPEQRWTRMRGWVARQIIATPEECNAVEVEPHA